MQLHGIGPSGAARLLGDVGDIPRFANRGHFASWNGTAPLDASSGDQNRHRLSRAGNRRINRVLHIMAIVQLRNDTEGRAYYRRKLAAGKTPWKPCAASNGACPTWSTSRCARTRNAWQRAREDKRGRLFNPARPTHTPTSTLRISHFPDPPTASLELFRFFLFFLIPGASGRRARAGGSARSRAGRRPGGPPGRPGRGGGLQR